MIEKTPGHYQSASQNGKGGMGEVCQAKGQKFVREPLSGGIFIHGRNVKTAFSKRIVQTCSLRFLSLKGAAATDDESTAETPREIKIVLNGFEELKQRVPANNDRGIENNDSIPDTGPRGKKGNRNDRKTLGHPGCRAVSTDPRCANGASHHAGFRAGGFSTERS